MVYFNFENTIEVLDSWGVTDVLIPFLLIFTIVFAILEKTKIFGENKKNINIIISLVLGLSVVIPHVTDSYPAGSDVVDMINISLPQVGLVAVAFIMLLILVGIYGNKWIGSALSGWMALISAIAVFVIFGGAAGWWESGWFYDVFGEDAISLFVMLIVFGLIIWFITKESSPSAKITDWLKDVGDFFKGGKND